jgi:hypothetical protein
MKRFLSKSQRHCSRRFLNSHISDLVAIGVSDLHATVAFRASTTWEARFSQKYREGNERKTR